MRIFGGRRVSAWAFLKRLYRQYDEHDLGDVAAELAYYFVYSLFPLIFCVATLAAYLPVKGYVDASLARLAPLMPPQATRLIEGHLQTLLGETRPRLLTLSVLVTVWFASRAVDAARIGLNRAYGVTESRPYWKTQLLAVGLTVGAAVAVLVAVALLALGGDAGLWLASHVGVGREYVLVWTWARWPATALVVMLLAAVLYDLLPDVEQKFRFITPGSVVGTLVWLAATWGFTEYAAHFGRYNVMYGSIGGVIVLMTWCYITGFVLLVGAELNALVEHWSPEGKQPGTRRPGEAPGKATGPEAPAGTRPAEEGA